jgi:hypothetical protein
MPCVRPSRRRAGVRPRSEGRVRSVPARRGCHRCARTSVTDAPGSCLGAVQRAVATDGLNGLRPLLPPLNACYVVRTSERRDESCICGGREFDFRRWRSAKAAFRLAVDVARGGRRSRALRLPIAAVMGVELCDHSVAEVVAAEVPLVEDRSLKNDRATSPLHRSRRPRFESEARDPRRAELGSQWSCSEGARWCGKRWS